MRGNFLKVILHRHEHTGTLCFLVLSFLPKLIAAVISDKRPQHEADDTGLGL